MPVAAAAADAAAADAAADADADADAAAISAAPAAAAAAATPAPRAPAAAAAAAAVRKKSATTSASTPKAAAAAATAPKLPPGDFSRVKKAVFVGSAVDLRQCPPDGKLPEFAVIGRSNVGKSSLINMLTSNDKLARVSKEPGMTKTINHYLINDSWYLVDLPGYGYAKASKGAAASWLGFTKDYFLNRDALVLVLLLVDASLPPQPIDVECARWLGDSEVPFAVVFTKADAARKRKKGEPAPAQNMAAFRRALMEDWETPPPSFETSSREGRGKAELLGFLAGMRRLEREGG